MYAIVETGGKQYRVREGDILRVERLEADEGSEIAIGSVLAAMTDDGLEVGRPRLEGARVVAKVVRQGRGRKIRIFKYKRRKGYRKRQGHRQYFTEIRIDRIELAGGSSDDSSERESENEPAAVTEG